LAPLRVGEITASGTALDLHNGEQRVVPPQASALVRVQLIQRRDQGVGDDALFCDGLTGGLERANIGAAVNRRQSCPE
jgi:hypothetical protein